MQAKKQHNFIQQIVADDLQKGYNPENLRFRFPPEPNGFLHIGHAAAICLNFGLGEKFNAPVNLRFDDTNPEKEEAVYIDAIKKDIAWLGFSWDKICYASDYFQQLYDWAVLLIKDGKAYVDSQNSETIAEQKGTPSKAGINSPYRERSVTENLQLFEKMKDGSAPQGSCVLRAKIDMANPNMHMRDPVMYRIMDIAHHRTGKKWRIFPMYDWTHGQSDYLENISHSFCTLEFKAHRELYEWYLTEINTHRKNTPKQREFARRNLSYTITSKRKLLRLIECGAVNGWDDPRMPTISGMRRRGYPAQAIRKFSAIAGIAKRDNVTDIALLEHCVKETLNQKAKRIMAVLDPLKIIITNYEKEQEILNAQWNPEDKNEGQRAITFAKTLYIEKEDFKEVAEKNYFRLTLGGEVRLKNAYIIKATSVEKDAEGNISCVYCTYAPKSKSGSGTPESLRKIKSTIHWVSLADALPIKVRLYDRLFISEAPNENPDKDFTEFLNPYSFTEKTAYAELAIKQATIGEPFQFQRKGYFCLDSDTCGENLIFNRTVTLKDNWGKKTKNTQKMPPKRHPDFDKAGGFAGKYLKAKTDAEKEYIKNEVQKISANIPVEIITNAIETAQSNKEFLRLLLLLPKKFDAREDYCKKLITKCLTLKNSTILFVTVQYILTQKISGIFAKELTHLKESSPNEFILKMLS